MAVAAERVEDVRVAWERAFERRFAGRPQVRRSVPDPRDADPHVPLPESLAPRPYRIAHEVARRLGCDPPTLLHTAANRDQLGAQAMVHQAPFAIRLIGPVAGALDDGALASLIGHELGHWLAHGPLAEPPSIALTAWQREASAYVTRLCSLAVELTADRFALLGSGGDLEAAVRLEVAISTGDCPRAWGLVERDYIDAQRTRVERSEDDLFARGSLPTSAFRTYAALQFWRTELHHELTGEGPGDLRVRDVDDELLARIRERHPERPDPPFRIPIPGVVAKGEKPAVALTALTEASRAPRGEQRTGAPPLGPVAATRAEPSVDELLGLDDLEQRFRALEAKEAAAAPATDDLETRFRVLEAAAESNESR